MALDPQDPAGNPSDAALAARVARLEAEVQTLRTDLEAMRASVEPIHASLQRRLPPDLRTALPRVTPGGAPPPPVPPSFARAGAKAESLESQLGSRVISKVAILLLLLGVAWFLKWAFDNHWIGPQGRVIAGLITGVSVVVWSEHFRRQKMLAFSYTLKAVGSGVLYLSLWAAFHLYHLVPSGVAFAAMVAVTIWNAVMAWSQDAPLLAGYALLGAYLTPALISTGGDHEIFLLSYLLVIAGCLLALLHTKDWNKLLLAPLPVTTIYFIAWYSEYFHADVAARTIALSLLLWVVFAATPFVVKNAEGIVGGVLMPIAAALFGALTLYSVLADSALSSWEAWCAIGFAIVYLALTRLRRGLAAAMHLSLAIVFLTVAIPLKLNGRGITLGWQVEAIALLYLSSTASLEPRARTAMRWLSCCSLLLGVGGALIEPFLLTQPQTAFFNREFAVALGAVVALAAAMMLSRRIGGEVASHFNGRVIAAGSLILISVVLLMAMHHEISRAFLSGLPTLDAWNAGREHADFAFSAWMMLEGAALLAAGFWRRSSLARWLGLLLLGATVIKALAYDTRSLGTGFRVLSMLALGVLLLCVSYAYQRDLLGMRAAESTTEDLA